MLTLDRDSFDLANRAAPEWIRELRSRGLEAYERLPMPAATEEVWRYVDLGFDLADLHLPEGPGTPLDDDPALASALEDVAGRAVVVDGFTVSADVDAPDGVVFTSLSSAVTEHEDLVRGALNQGIPADLDKLAAAHRAFQRDGVFLYVPRGRAMRRPLHVDLQATPGAPVSLPHVTVVVEDAAEASLIVTMRSPDGVPLVVVPQIEGSVRDGAHFRLTTMQQWGDATRAVAQQRLVAGRDASVTFGEVGLGGRLARLHLIVDLMGRGSVAAIVGAYFGDRAQVLDYRYFMNHAAPNTRSDMFLKGAVEDDSTSIFTGLIRIEEEAQKTEAFQTNRNLVLSEGAMANSVPNLEILANDVKCGHGSTMGPLDEEQRYYLQSRGLDRVHADRLQVRGFFEEAIRRLPAPRLAAVVRERVNAKFVAAQEEGRV